jgi:hypothetical protein
MARIPPEITPQAIVNITLNSDISEVTAMRMLNPHIKPAIDKKNTFR